MGDTNPVKFQAQPEGQPEAIQQADSNVQGNEQANNGHKPAFELDQIQEIVKKTVHESLQTFSREQQSQRDRMEARIKNEVDKRIGLFKDAGFEVTDEVKQTIETSARNDIFNESQSNDSQSNAGQQRNEGQRQDNPDEERVNAELAELDKEYGVSLDVTDPEAKTIPQNLSPYKFIRAYEKALKAKADRLATDEQGTSNPFAQMHTGGGSQTPGNPLANITDKDQLWQLGFGKK